jgi:hypothetical protein
MQIVTIHLACDTATAELEFRCDREIVAVVRGLPRRRWNPQLRRWTIASTEVSDLYARPEALGVQAQVAHAAQAAHPAHAAHATPVAQPSPAGKRLVPVDISAARALQLEAAEQELKLRRYSPRTRRAYLKLLRRCLAETDSGPITAGTMRGYVPAFVERGASAAYHGQLRAALRFLSLHVLRDASLAAALPSPKRE